MGVEGTFCDDNSITAISLFLELVWAQLKEYLRSYGDKIIKDVQEKALERMAGFNKEKALKLFKHCEKLEQEATVKAAVQREDEAVQDTVRVLLNEMIDFLSL